MDILLNQPALPWEPEPGPFGSLSYYPLDDDADDGDSWLAPRSLDGEQSSMSDSPWTFSVLSPTAEEPAAMSPVVDGARSTAGLQPTRRLTRPAGPITKTASRPRRVRGSRQLLVCSEPSCIYTTNRSGNFERHVRNAHTKVKPFKCDVCNYASADSGAVTRHKRQHTGEAPAICKYAGCRCTYTSNPPLLVMIRPSLTDRLCSQTRRKTSATSAGTRGRTQRRNPSNVRTRAATTEPRSLAPSNRTSRASTPRCERSHARSVYTPPRPSPTSRSTPPATRESAAARDCGRDLYAQLSCVRTVH